MQRQTRAREGFATLECRSLTAPAAASEISSPTPQKAPRKRLPGVGYACCASSMSVPRLSPRAEPTAGSLRRFLVPASALPWLNRHQHSLSPLWEQLYAHHPRPVEHGARIVPLRTLPCVCVLVKSGRFRACEIDLIPGHAFRRFTRENLTETADPDPHRRRLLALVLPRDECRNPVPSIHSS